MYTDKQMIRLLERNLHSECDIIKFYLENLHKLNYAKNKKAIDELILGSVRHSELIVKTLIKLNSKGTSIFNHDVAGEAFREESAVREIYAYQLARTGNTEIKKLLKTLIKEEGQHEKLVRGLK
ncbi:hypothetical protein KY363_03605 [Candidatus Woesearchaeota archaeon]|nr:hypothetical protein [Candidatus Woesearchaeota archaeon]